jgi:hypothetical protein
MAEKQGNGGREAENSGQEDVRTENYQKMPAEMRQKWIKCGENRVSPPEKRTLLPENGKAENRG